MYSFTGIGLGIIRLSLRSKIDTINIKVEVVDKSSQAYDVGWKY